MARKGNPARLVIALSVAAVLAVFLLYTSLAGGGTPSLRPSSLAGHDGKVSLTGRVLKPVTGDAHGAGLRFRLRDVNGNAAVAVLYKGLVPELFRPGRDIARLKTIQRERELAASETTTRRTGKRPRARR